MENHPYKSVVAHAVVRQVRLIGHLGLCVQTPCISIIVSVTTIVSFGLQCIICMLVLSSSKYNLSNMSCLITPNRPMSKADTGVFYSTASIGFIDRDHHAAM